MRGKILWALAAVALVLTGAQAPAEERPAAPAATRTGAKEGGDELLDPSHPRRKRESVPEAPSDAKAIDLPKAEGVAPKARGPVDAEVPVPNVPKADHEERLADKRNVVVRAAQVGRIARGKVRRRRRHPRAENAVNRMDESGLANDRDYVSPPSRLRAGPADGLGRWPGVGRFAGSVNRIVPRDVRLARLPRYLDRAYPEFGGFGYLGEGPDSLIVDPVSRRIVAVVVPYGKRYVDPAYAEPEREFDVYGGSSGTYFRVR